MASEIIDACRGAVIELEERGFPRGGTILHLHPRTEENARLWSGITPQDEDKLEAYVGAGIETSHEVPIGLVVAVHLEAAARGGSDGIAIAEIEAHGGADYLDRWDDRLAESGLRTRAPSEWGYDTQLIKAAEEFAELAASLNRHLNDQEAMNDLLEELIDARIMLWQIAAMFPVADLEEQLDEKLDRLDRMLSESEGVNHAE